MFGIMGLQTSTINLCCVYDCTSIVHVVYLLQKQFEDAQKQNEKVMDDLKTKVWKPYCSYSNDRCAN